MGASVLSFAFLIISSSSWEEAGHKRKTTNQSTGNIVSHCGQVHKKHCNFHFSRRLRLQCFCILQENVPNCILQFGFCCRVKPFWFTPF